MKTTIGGTAGGRPAGARPVHAGRQTKSLKGGKAELEVDDGYVVAPKGRDNENTTAAKMSDGLGAGFSTKVPLPPSEDGRTDAFKADSGVKVNLSEIMMLSQKKPRKPNGAFFTIVPSMVDQLFQKKKTDNDCSFFASGRLRGDSTHPFCHRSRRCWHCA